MTGIIIQARKGSTRLPNKMVLPFYENKGVLELLIEKLTTQFSKEIIVLATTTNPIDDELEAIAKNYKINCFRGNENNVLQRFIETGEKYNFNNIIRICADNPFLDIGHITTLIDEIESKDIDYTSYKTENGLPTIKSHLGLYAEGVSLKALKQVNKSTSLPLYQEHVTNFIYENSNDFGVKLLGLPSYMRGTDKIRLTLDTLIDFKFEKELYKEMKKKSTKCLINYLKKQSELLEEMDYEISRNSK